jgi:hypothetical protein
MDEKTLTGHTWVAFGPAGAIGSIHSADGGYTFKLMDDTDFRGLFRTLDAAKSALQATMPSGSERPEYREH